MRLIQHPKKMALTIALAMFGIGFFLFLVQQDEPWSDNMIVILLVFGSLSFALLTLWDSYHLLRENKMKMLWLLLPLSFGFFGIFLLMLVMAFKGLRALMKRSVSMDHGNYKFIGGIQIGWLSTSWPFGILEVNGHSLVLRDKLLGRRFEFTRHSIERIEPKKIIPTLACGLRIHPGDKTKPNLLYFWYGGDFDRLIGVLREFKWLV